MPKPLTPEKAFNLSAGTVADFGNLTVTVDYYRIKVRDRIALTDKIRLTDDQKNRLRDAEVSKMPKTSRS